MQWRREDSVNFFDPKFLFSCGTDAQLKPCDCPELAVCGRSNAGKSSLINKLCRRKNLARVSSTPGKTTTVNFFSLGEGCRLADLPGYGYAKRSDAEKRRWAGLMEAYFTSGRQIALALLLLDCRREINADDTVMLEVFRTQGIPFAAVLTKSDKLSKSALAQSVESHTAALAPYSPAKVLSFTVNEEQPVERLRQIIAGFFPD